jgi:hypothetical protein
LNAIGHLESEAIKEKRRSVDRQKEYHLNARVIDAKICREERFRVHRRQHSGGVWRRRKYHGSNGLCVGAPEFSWRLVWTVEPMLCSRRAKAAGPSAWMVQLKDGDPGGELNPKRSQPERIFSFGARSRTRKGE